MVHTHRQWGNGEWKLWRMSPSSPNILSYLSSQAGWERHIRSGDFWKIKISNCRKVPKQPDQNSLFNRLIHFNRRQVRHGDQPWYPHVLWPLRWTIAHSTWMVPLFHQDYTCTTDKTWTVCYNGVHAHTHTMAPIWGIPRITNLYLTNLT